MNHTSLWVSEGHSVMEQRVQNLKPDEPRSLCTLIYKLEMVIATTNGHGED